MAIKFIDDTILTAIANAIRTKLSSSDTYKPSEMATAIGSISGGITPTGTKQINTNGTHDVTAYASAEVNVPNSYAAGDEGKVVSNGALVAQSSDSVTQNGTVDTTLINSLTVNVPSPQIYYNDKGHCYLKDMENTGTAVPNAYESATYLETYYAPNATTYNSNTFWSCTNLKSVNVPKITTFNTNYLIRQQGGNANKLESVTIGSIGYPVTSISTSNWRYGSHAMELVVTCYVNASSIADVPTAVSTNINGNNAYAPSGSVVTIVYRNSETGDILT